MRDLDKIRNMTDEELARYLKRLSNNRGDRTCSKCGKTANFVVKIENTEAFQTKKLCGLCDKCYQELLNYLELYDIIWKD